MAAGDTQITIVGNLVGDPELRYTPTGQAVATFRVASTPRFRDNTTGEWKDGDSLFLSCNVWRQAAENVAESLQRGMRVIVSGRLRQRSYETREGEKRTVYEIEVDEVGPSLRNASAKVVKSNRSSGNFAGQGGGGGGYSGGGGNQRPAEDPWTADPSYVDYKDTPLLRKFISDRGKIRARRVTGNCTQHQRDVATAIKNAREMAMLPYTSTPR